MQTEKARETPGGQTSFVPLETSVEPLPQSDLPDRGISNTLTTFPLVTDKGKVNLPKEDLMLSAEDGNYFICACMTSRLLQCLTLSSQSLFSIFCCGCCLLDF